MDYLISTFNHFYQLYIVLFLSIFIAFWLNWKKKKFYGLYYPICLTVMTYCVVQFDSFNVIAATFYEHYDDILNCLQQQSIKCSSRIFQLKNKIIQNESERSQRQKFLFVQNQKPICIIPTFFLLSHLFPTDPLYLHILKRKVKKNIIILEDYDIVTLFETPNFLSKYLKRCVRNSNLFL